MTAEPCNCLFENDEQVMWCDLHLRLREDLQSSLDLLESAWGLIANANEGFWERATPMWRSAANQWRDQWLKR